MHNYKLRSLAISATLHCLLGCSIGEVAGLILGTAFGLSNFATFSISIVLAFVFGYSLSIRPLLRAGLALAVAVPIILAADTLSIASMEIADNVVMAIIPGAMNAGLSNPLFWLTIPLSLGVGFVVAVPVNYYLLARGRGHALVHEFHSGHAAGHGGHSTHTHDGDTHDEHAHDMNKGA